MWDVASHKFDRRKKVFYDDRRKPLTIYLEVPQDFDSTSNHLRGLFPVIRENLIGNILEKKSFAYGEFYYI